MPRPLPRVRSSCWYHVTDRAPDRAVLLPTPAARDRFVRALGERAYAFAVEIHAYCAMETHLHVLARADESELERAFATPDADGSPAGEGVRCRRLAFGRHLLQVTRYIHLNPVQAGLVARPGDWRWSSYAGYVDSLRAPPWLRTGAVLGWLGSVAVRQRYRRFVEGVDLHGDR